MRIFAKSKLNILVKKKMQTLSQFDCELIDILQMPLAICEKPFDKIAKQLGSNPEEVIKESNYLFDKGFIKYITAAVNAKALGKVTTLMVAKVQHDKVDQVAGYINRQANVSHNYLRANEYNLWFTAQGQSQKQIEKQFKKIGDMFQVEFHSLPAEKVFKLDVRFNLATKPVAKIIEKQPCLQNCEVVVLSDIQKRILGRLQKGLRPKENMFDIFDNEGIRQEQVIEIIKGLVEKKVIKKIRAVVDYKKLGFKANIMFAAKAEEKNIDENGWKLASLQQVSHCYRRPAFEKWPYNLYAMAHAIDKAELVAILENFAKESDIKEFQMLETVRELKKQPVTY